MSRKKRRAAGEAGAGAEAGAGNRASSDGRESPAFPRPDTGRAGTPAGREIPAESGPLFALASLSPLVPSSLLALALLVGRFLPFEEPDLWWHFTVGRDIAAGGIAFGDLHSYTLPGYRWVDHEWLLNLLWYGMVGEGRSTLPVAMLCLALTLAALATVLLPRRRNGGGVPGLPLAAAILLPLAAWTIGTGVGMRPTVVSLAFLALLWWWIREPEWAGRRTAWLLPPLFVLWANLHGGFVVALALLGLDGVLVRLRGDVPGTKRRAVIFGACFAATLVNPYHVRVWHEAAVVFFDSYAHRTITEWQPPAYGEPRWRPLLAFQGIAVALLLRRLVRDRAKAPWLDIAAVAVFLVLVQRSMRHAPLLVVVALPAMAATLAGAFSRFRPRRTAAAAVSIAVSLALSIPATMLLRKRGADLAWNNGEGRHRGYPAGAVEHIREQAIPSERVVADYGWGGFLPWVAPEMKVFVDGRMASWNAPTPWGGKAAGPHVLREYHAMSQDPVERPRLLEKWNTGWFLGSRAAWDATGMSTSAPNVEYADGTSVLVRIR